MILIEVRYLKIVEVFRITELSTAEALKEGIKLFMSKHGHINFDEGKLQVRQLKKPLM